MDRKLEMPHTFLLALKRQTFVSLQETPVLTVGTCGQWMVDRDFRFVHLDMTGIKMLHWLFIGELSPFALFWIARANNHQNARTSYKFSSYLHFTQRLRRVNAIKPISFWNS